VIVLTTIARATGLSIDPPTTVNGAGRDKHADGGQGVTKLSFGSDRDGSPGRDLTRTAR
jgi:hypothetical protein